MSSSFATDAQNSCGFLMSNPQPSLVFPSSATAPLCVRRFSAFILVLITQCDGLSSIFAMSPKPQLSFSNIGSYKPLVLWVLFFVISS